MIRTGARQRGRCLLVRALQAGLPLVVLAACGGSGNPLDNPPAVVNPAGAASQRLSFAYFQYCVNPIFGAAPPITVNGTCSSGGCHNDSTGRGGAFRVVPGAVADPGTDTPAVIVTTDIYKNFLSAQGETVPGNPGQSLLINKPLVRNVLHGGGVVFASDQDPSIKTLEYWISNPMPAGQDEFSTAGNNLFLGGTPLAANCLTAP